MGRKREHASDNARKLAYKRKSTTKERQREQYIERWRSRPFVAIDGEGEDDSSKNHFYTMLSASDGLRNVSIENTFLSTMACFDFLLGLHSDYPTAIFVGFSINYDINMMLADLDIDSLKQLNNTGFVAWNMYGISWIPSKIFRISRYARGIKGPVQTITIYDVFGFFQTSFLNTLRSWKIGTAEELRIIEKLKAQRGQFAQVDNQEILSYNTLECELLVQLMNSLRNALDTAGLYIPSWHGAGAVGGELLRINNIKSHIADVPTEINDAIMRAYFGGRFQTLLLGDIGESWGHDLKSAYPSAFLDLPSLHGRWEHTDEYIPHHKWALYRVQWSLPANTPVSPFPHRHKRRINYPHTGEGWYWYPEVSSALSLATMGNSTVQVQEGWIFYPDNDEKPFAFLVSAYQARKEFAAVGNSAEKVIKLGINSVYGKTAQGTRRSGKTPAFQSYIWAGYCTSVCRARVYEMAMRNPDAVIGFATDGIFATERLTTENEEGNEMGQWESSPSGYMFWAQSGVYFNVLPQDGRTRLSKRTNRKTRGLGKKEISFAYLRKQWLEKQYSAEQTITIRRFFGLQYCLHANRMEDWRKWKEIEKTLSMQPNSWSYVSLPRTGKKRLLDKRNLRLRQVAYAGLSEPYQTKGADVTSDNTDLQELYNELDQPEFNE